MKRQDPTSTVHEGAQTGRKHAGGAAADPTERSGDSSGVLDDPTVLGLLEENQPERVDSGDTVTMRTITRMPEGIEVVEQRAGVAEGQWLLQVRCQCGRRWFETEAVPAATCPRCGLLVYINIAAPRPPS